MRNIVVFFFFFFNSSTYDWLNDIKITIFCISPYLRQRIWFLWFLFLFSNLEFLIGSKQIPQNIYWFLFLSFHCEMRQIENSNNVRCGLYWVKMLPSPSHKSAEARTLAMLGLLLAQMRILLSKWQTEKCIWDKDAWFPEGFPLKVTTSSQTTVHEIILRIRKLLCKIKLNTTIWTFISFITHEPWGIYSWQRSVVA